MTPRFSIVAPRVFSRFSRGISFGRVGYSEDIGVTRSPHDEEEGNYVSRKWNQKIWLEIWGGY